MNIMLVCFHALGSNAQYAYLITFVVTLKRNRRKSSMNEILVSYFNDVLIMMKIVFPTDRFKKHIKEN